MQKTIDIEHEEIPIKHIRTRTTIKIDIDVDYNFWAITPAFNINLHSNTFEFEWLCIGIYIRRDEK